MGDDTNRSNRKMLGVRFPQSFCKSLQIQLFINCMSFILIQMLHIQKTTVSFFYSLSKSSYLSKVIFIAEYKILQIFQNILFSTQSIIFKIFLLYNLLSNCTAQNFNSVIAHINSEVFICFIDFEAEFYMVPHNQFIETLKGSYIDDKDIRL